MSRAVPNAPGRPLLPLPELVTMVNDAEAALEALCFVLHKADSHLISADRIYTLLAPIQVKLNTASCDLTDMRL